MDFGHQLPEQGQQAPTAGDPPIAFEPDVRIILSASATRVLANALLNAANQSDEASKGSDSLNKAL